MQINENPETFYVNFFLFAVIKEKKNLSDSIRKFSENKVNSSRKPYFFSVCYISFQNKSSTNENHILEWNFCFQKSWTFEQIMHKIYKNIFVIQSWMPIMTCWKKLTWFLTVNVLHYKKKYLIIAKLFFCKHRVFVKIMENKYKMKTVWIYQ